MIEINNEELLEVHAQSLASQSFLARSDHFVMGDKIKVLDYGCGSGVVSESLQFNSNSILGVDKNVNLVKEFNQKFQSRGVPIDKLQATTEIPKTSKFDVIVEGELLIVDYCDQPFSDSAVLNSTFTGDHIDPPENNVQPHSSAIPSNILQSAIHKAGLIDYSYRPAFLLDYKQNKIPFFIATGVKS
ncbi:hypothetical protein E3Q10_01193 [Wallemia mellicola]|uniref:Methyltransferase domain-containing protein n=1 Tax=Wallemia mellicola TaxID=1708541 RepID=A0A4T0NBL2_9BASI|nr:hypothetical protein E3Q19_00529 [Wallemia mellicola]TIC14454.1 hypothetical protein E3Q14_00808 [Wallemia mellicola]TIC16287.1 hypothetical protein E3Q15_01180 [Wallemia mellicola]TIC32564.1 hypothetical protein E3Q10_01193 [Wallemia mellicola]TIC33182.1 hypothetical protein E3Q11_00217 [Wallemia mellicola]